jgi:hypothetical protein
MSGGMRKLSIALARPPESEDAGIGPLNCKKFTNVDRISVIPAYGLTHVLARVMAAMVLASVILPLGGCWGSAGEGTIDIARARAASYTNANPQAAKAASARARGLTGTAQKSRRK